MADEVDEVKAKVDIVGVIGERVDLRKAGSNFKALCPFHSEKTPSFMVSPELQIYKCFGCGESGDVIEFLEKYEGMTFREALEYLAEKAGVKLKPFRGEGSSIKQKIFEINSNATRFYQHVLFNHPTGRRARDYLIKERQLKPKIIKEFKLGFSPDVPLAFKKFLIDKKGYKLDEIDKAGLIYRSGRKAFDRFRGRVIFPLFDHRGNVVGFAGRVLPERSEDKAKYINSPETPAYHKSRNLYGLCFAKGHIKKDKQAVVVEGELDMISSWQAGIKNAVAIKGTAITDEQIRLLRRFTKKIILALDADFAGDVAARRGIEIAEAEGLEVSVVSLKDYKDPDEIARKAPTKYKKMLKKPIPVWDFMVESVFSRFDKDTGPGKAKISKELGPLLASIDDKIVQSHYINLVSKKLGVGVDAVASQVLKTPRREGAIEQREDEEKGKSRRQMLEERLLSLAFQSDASVVLEKTNRTLIKTPLAKKIVDELANYLKENKSFDASDFAVGLPKELLDGFAEIALKDEGDIVESSDELEKELALVKKDLLAVDIKEKLEQAEKEIKKYEEEGLSTKLKKAQEKFDKLAKELSLLKRENGEERIILQS